MSSGVIFWIFLGWLTYVASWCVGHPGSSQESGTVFEVGEELRKR